MNREMNKKERQLPDEETKALLYEGHHGMLAVNGDGGYPYSVPINYVYVDGYIYIHSATYGYKVEALQKDNKVCFSAILSSEIVPARFTAKFESVIAFGTACFVEEPSEKQRVLEVFVDRFSPEYKEKGLKFIKGAFDKTAIIKVEVEEISGKAYRGGDW